MDLHEELYRQRFEMRKRGTRPTDVVFTYEAWDQFRHSARRLSVLDFMDTEDRPQSVDGLRVALRRHGPPVLVLSDGSSDRK